MGKLGKHDHKLTNILKACIFSLIMLAPLIAIGVKCLYVVNNKNAYESYYGETINESNYENIETLKINNTYYLINNIPINTNNQYMNDYWQMSVANFTYQNIEYSTIKFFPTSNANLIMQLIEYGQTTINVSLGTNLMNISFTIMGTMEENGLYKDYIKPYLYELEYNNYSYLDNVFYYSIHNLEEQETFNWVQNTAIYTPLNAMCSGLGITERAIPILLCYWSLMTAIYIVFDIIIYLFTKMTHFIGTN